MTDLDPRKHGIDPTQLAIRANEISEFNRFLNGLFDDMRPSGEIQRILFGQILHANWNMRIVRREEAIIILESGAAAPALKIISQSYTRYERSFYKAVGELRNIQTELAYRATLAGEQCVPIPDIPPLVRTAHVHKLVRSTIGRKTLSESLGGIRRNQSSG